MIKMDSGHWNKGIFLGVMLIPGVLAYFCTETLLEGLMVSGLILLAGVVGVGLGRIGSGPEKMPEGKNPATTTRPQSEGIRETLLCREPVHNHLRGLLEELDRMHSSEDLLDRYHCFVTLIERLLNRSLGSCSISLWCPDELYEELIECVIPSAGLADTGGRGGLSSAGKGRVPCRVPLGPGAILTSLKSGRVYLSESNTAHSVGQANPNEGALRCDVCIPLYREYGLPLLVLAERPPVSPHVDGAAGREGQSSVEEIAKAIDMIKLIWHQLQGINQRQWSIEHDDPSGVLRAEAFMRQAQGFAERACRQDEPFSLVVITIRGFRGMFAGQSGQWRDLSRLVGRGFTEALKQKGRSFLLGKMADDVFALCLAQTDTFLAQAVMKTLTAVMEEQIGRDPLVRKLDIMALEMAWTLADHRDYGGDVEQMLDGIYRRLFCRDGEASKHSWRMVLPSPAEEGVALCK